MKFFEAATIRSRARAAAKALKDLLADKTLPKALRAQVETLHTSLGKTWADLEKDASYDPEQKESGMFAREQSTDFEETANVGQWLEARLHTMFTTMADDMFGGGYLTREERKALSHGIGQALDAFIAAVEETAPALYQRRPYTYPEDGQAAPMSEGGLSEPARLEKCVEQVMAKGTPEKNAYAICQAAMGENARPPKGVSLEVFEMARAIMTGKKAKESAIPLLEIDLDEFTALMETAEDAS